MSAMNTRFRWPFGAIASMALILAAAGTLHADSSPAASPLATAQTIQVHETLSAGNSSANAATLDVSIARPNKVSVTFHLKHNDKPRTALYIDDGTSEHECDSLSDTYTNLDPQPNGESASQIRDISAIDLLLNNGAFGPTPSGVQRTTSMVTLDGRAMQLTIDTWPSHKDPADDKSYHSLNRVWIDVATGLPYRRSLGSVEESNGGKIDEFQVLTFSNWVFDKPVQIAWAPPAGYTLHFDPKLLDIGATAPDFSAVTADGKTVHLSDFRGKPVVLDFWATWCGPCQHSMPHLEKVYDEVKDKGVAVLAVCVWDDKPAYLKWAAAKTGIYMFQTAFDPAGRGDNNIAAKLYNVTAIPTQYVIDMNGKVAAAYMGYEEGEHRLETALASIDIAAPVTPSPQQSASAK
jgi:peroxiredoxin